MSQDLFGAHLAESHGFASTYSKQESDFLYTRKSKDSTRHGRWMDTKHEQDISDLIRRKMAEYGRDNEVLVIFNRGNHVS
jgi:hypothetical protein